MQKLLGILGTIIIAGSGISGIVGNAPTSTKNKINYSQTNDLEKLNRNKRQNNNNDSLNVGKSLNVSSNPKNYFASLKEIFNDLVKNNVFYKISYTNANDSNTKVAFSWGCPEFCVLIIHSEL